MTMPINFIPIYGMASSPHSARGHRFDRNPHLQAVSICLPLWVGQAAISVRIDFTTTCPAGTMDHDVFADNVLYWTSGGIRFNPRDSASIRSIPARLR